MLVLTVPEGRGHLRTKWRISRQLCAHTLRWPSIIHSLLPPSSPPPPPSPLWPLHLSPLSPSLPLLLFFTPRQRVRLTPSPLFSHLSPSCAPCLHTPPPVTFARFSADTSHITKQQHLPNPVYFVSSKTPDLIQTPSALVANTS